MIFGKVGKKIVFGASSGTHWSILEPILEIRGSQNPPFSRVCYRRVTCRYTSPKKQHKEKVMWGRVQCKIGKQRLAKTVLTRSAGSFSGPGADFLTPSDFEWGSQNQPFLKQIQKNEKKEVQKTALTKTWFVDRLFIEFRIDFGIIFDVFFIPWPFAHATF